MNHLSFVCLAMLCFGVKGNPDIGFLVFGGLGCFWFYDGFRSLKKKRVIENIPTSNIQSMPLGLVELQGKALQKYKLTSPFSQTACVYYSYLIEEYRRQGKHSKWVTIAAGSSDEVEFYLQDATGTATIAPKGASVIVPEDHKIQRDGALFDQAVRFLESLGHSSTGFLGLGRKLRFQESFIAPGDFVFIIGTAKSTTEEAIGSRKDRLIAQLRQIKKDPKLMARFDTNRDGTIDAAEWEEARRVVQQELVKKDEAAEQVRVCSDKNNFFVISDHSEKDLTRKLGWRAFGGVFGGAAMTIGMAAYFIVRIGI